MRSEAAAVGVADALDEGGAALDAQGVTVALSDDACVLETGRVLASGDSKDLAQDDRARQAYLGGHVGA